MRTYQTLLLLASLGAAITGTTQSRIVEQPLVMKQHEQFVSYWTDEPNWHSELQLRNTSPRESLTVLPSIVSAAGQEFPLTPVKIRPQAVIAVDLSQAVAASAPSLVGTYGSLTLRYESLANRHLYAAVMIHRMGRPIAFHIDAMGLMDAEGEVGRQGIWWLPKVGTQDYLILTNQSTRPVPLRLTVSDKTSKQFLKQLTLAARETRRLSIRTLLQEGSLTGRYGGISVLPTSNGQALDSLHVAFDEQNGFSATLKMFDYSATALLSERDHTKSGMWTLRAPMLALSSPDPALAFPPGTVLHPTLFLRNVSTSTRNANLSFAWRTDEASKGLVKGAKISLAPHETKQVLIEDLPRDLAPPSGAHWASVYLQTDAKPDEVVAVAASYDDTLRYGAQTPFIDQLSFLWKGGQWEYDGSHNSLITVGNDSESVTKALFTIFYEDGTAARQYEVEKEIAAHDQMWIDIGSLIRNQTPDRNGLKLPSQIKTGSYEFRDETNHAVGRLFEGKVIYDTSYGHVTYGCATCCGIAQSRLTYNPFGLGLSNTFTNGVQVFDNCNSGWQEDSIDFPNWTTGNTSIATTTNVGVHTGMQLGGTTSYTYGQVQGKGNRYTCPIQTRAPQGPTNVVKISVSPSPILMSSGDTSVLLNVSVTPSSYANSEAISFGTLGNPDSASQASLSFAAPPTFTGNDSWTIQVAGTNSPSTISSAKACAGTACSSNSSIIYVPPQVFVQVLYGEAHGQAASGDTISEPAVAASIKNRLNNSGFGSPSTYQAIITSAQYNGIATQITTGQQPELLIANSAWTGAVPDSVAGSPCFFTPDASGFNAIKQAYNSSATTVPPVNSDPKCYGSNRQLVWKTSIGNNIALPGVPAFIFERQKVGSAAVVQIP